MVGERLEWREAPTVLSILLLRWYTRCSTTKYHSSNLQTRGLFSRWIIISSLKSQIHCIAQTYCKTVTYCNTNCFHLYVIMVVTFTMHDNDRYRVSLIFSKICRCIFWPKWWNSTVMMYQVILSKIFSSCIPYFNHYDSLDSIWKYKFFSPFLYANLRLRPWLVRFDSE